MHDLASTSVNSRGNVNDVFLNSTPKREENFKKPTKRNRIPQPPYNPICIQGVWKFFEAREVVDIDILLWYF